MSLFKQLKNSLLRLDREKLHLSFLTDCRDYGVIPKFLRVKSNFVSRIHAKRKYNFEYNCLKSTIRSKHALVSSIHKKIYGYRNSGLYYQFSSYAVGGVYDHAMRLINNFREVQEMTIKNRHEKKLNNLTGGLSSSTNNQVSGFLNFSDHIFTDNQMRILNKGPKYIHNSTSSPIDLIPQLEDIIKHVDSEHRDQVRCQVFLTYSKFLKSKNFKSSIDQKIIKSIKEIPNLIFLPTDKSNKLAALNYDDFLQKMSSTIASLDCTIVSEDPLTSIINKTIRLTKEFKTSEWSDDIKKLARVNNLGLIPKMVAVIKDHKPSLPLRPIVLRNQSPTFFIEKTLVLILKDLLPISAHTVKSSKDFILKLDNIQLPTQFIMFSLDIISLYPSIDMAQATDYISKQLTSNSSISIHMRSTILAAFNLVISSNYFLFNNVIYFQQTGAPMGSPVSAIAAECILRPLEESFLESTTLKPLCWFRYVDDIFGIWPATSTDFTDFFNSLNQCNPRIQFTMELEHNAQISFLDILLTKRNNTISRSIHRKSINSNCTIPFDANTTTSYKKAAYRSYIRRAFNICSQDTINDELSVIRNIAMQNGYSISFIDDIITEINLRLQNTPTNNSILQSQRISLTYNKDLHERLKRIFKSFNIQLIAQSGKKLKDVLKSNIDPTPFNKVPGVYQIPILHQDNSKTFYIGQTARKLEVRLKEHRNDIRNNKRNSALARSVYNDPSLQVQFNDAKIIAPYTNSARTLIRESLEIQRRKTEICNDQDSYSIPNIWFSLIK